MSGTTVHIKLDDGTEYDMPESVAMQAMQDFDAHGVKFEADDKPREPKGAATVFSEPDPNLKAPDERNILEQLLNPSGAPPTEENLAAIRQGVRDKTEQFGAMGLGMQPAGMLAASANAGRLARAGTTLGNVALNAGQAGLQTGLQHYQDNPDDVLGALLAARESAGQSGALGLTGAAALGMGDLLQSGSDRARQAAYRASKEDLRDMGVTPREFAQRTDELGLNNRFKPMDPSDKRARIADVKANRGDQHDAAIAVADAQNPIAGRDINAEIARDIDTNADRVWTGGSNQAEPIVSAMGKTANAAERRLPGLDLPSELAEYRTQQGKQAFGRFGSLVDSASGKGALAAYDSADQKLHEAMRASGDANYQLFTSADNDFHDVSLLEELTRQPAASNPWRRPVGAAVGGGLGFAMGGYGGAAVGAGISDMTREYHADAAANAMALGSQGATATGNAMLGAQGMASGPLSQMNNQPHPQTGPSASEQITQIRNQSRGQELPNVVESVLQNPPPWMAQYAQQLSKAKEDGNLPETLYKLENTDDNWKESVLPRLMMMSGPMQ